MTHLNNKYPLLGLPQYLPTLKAHGIVYAESVGSFEKGYYVELGMAEGAVGPFLTGVKKALKLKRKKTKRAKHVDKENERNREESIEI
jgi:hypothetical protein